MLLKDSENIGLLLLLLRLTVQTIPMIQLRLTVISSGDRWIRTGGHWMGLHVALRTILYAPEGGADGPDLTMLSGVLIVTKLSLSVI